MITSFIEMLELPLFGHMVTSTIHLCELQDKILLITSRTELVTSWPYSRISLVQKVLQGLLKTQTKLKNYKLCIKNAIYICISWHNKSSWILVINADVKEHNGCVTWFMYFLDLLWVMYNCTNFHHCRICVSDLMDWEGGAFCPPSVRSLEKVHFEYG